MALSNLLARISGENEKELIHLYTLALFSSHKESFDELLKNAKCATHLNKHLLLKENAQHYISCAALGDNVELLKEIIELYKTRGKPTPLSDVEISKCILLKAHPRYGDNAINMAIQRGSVACVQLLLEQLVKQSRSLTQCNY